MSNGKAMIILLIAGLKKKDSINEWMFSRTKV